MERCWSVSQRGDYQRARYCAVSSNVHLRLRKARERERKCHRVSTTVVKAGITKRPKEQKFTHVDVVEQLSQFEWVLAETVTPGGGLKQPFRSLVSHYSALMRPPKGCTYAKRGCAHWRCNEWNMHVHMRICFHHRVPPPPTTTHCPAVTDVFMEEIWCLLIVTAEPVKKERKMSLQNQNGFEGGVWWGGGHNEDFMYWSSTVRMFWWDGDRLKGCLRVKTWFEGEGLGQGQD